MSSFNEGIEPDEYIMSCLSMYLICEGTSIETTSFHPNELMI